MAWSHPSPALGRLLPLILLALPACQDDDVTQASGDTSSDTSGGGACVPGEQIECACPGASSGVQACAPNGASFGPCMCDPSMDTTGETMDGTSCGPWSETSAADDGGSSEDDDTGGPSCGDGAMDPGEDCDDAGESVACNEDCTLATCGDGVVNAAAGEACDDAGESGSCNEDCTLATCGDGVVNAAAGEACDEGAATADCDVDCTVSLCGDGVVNVLAGEDCDDAGKSAACNDDCTGASCGDGVLNVVAGEICDDAGASETCDVDCTPAACGDGVINAVAGETCDDAGESATCDADCTAAACGDGVVNTIAGEACDDGGLVSGGGCSATCTAEPCDAIEFTTSQARISMDPTGWGLGTANFTLEFWIQHHGDFVPGGSGTGGNGWVLGMNEDYGVDTVQTALGPNAEVNCITYNGSCPCGPGSDNAFVSSPPIDDGAWHHVACVRDGDQMVMFFDGTLAGTNPIDVNLQASSPVSLGRKAGYPTSVAAPVALGPIRFSATARYSTDFTPAVDWAVNDDTVAQYLTSTTFDGSTLVDEAGSDNQGMHDQDVVAIDACP